MIFVACFLVISFALFCARLPYSLSLLLPSHSLCFCARWFGLRWVCLWLRSFVAALWLNIMENGSNSFRLMKTNGQLAPQGQGRGQLQQGTTRHRGSKATRHGNLFAQVSLPSLMGSNSRCSAELWRQLSSLCGGTSFKPSRKCNKRESKAAWGSTSAPATQLWLGMSFIRHNLKPSASSGVKVELQTTAMATS